jgi:hypothetical protein
MTSLAQLTDDPQTAEVGEDFAATVYVQWLLRPDGGACVEVKDLGDGLYAGIKPLLFHWTMIAGLVGDYFSYSDRWCFADRALAEIAIRNWSGNGDPVGWHRHPSSGRRREGGDPNKETISP